MQNVKLYALTTCAYCQTIKKMLTDLKIPFECIELDLLFGNERKIKMEELTSINNQKSFPTTVISEKVIIGYKIQEIKETLGIKTDVDKLYEQLKTVHEKKGYYFNRNKERSFELIRGLLTNKDRYGYMACPCRLSDGERELDKDIICPCDYRAPDVDEFGVCYCGLYVAEHLKDEMVDDIFVPERREQ